VSEASSAILIQADQVSYARGGRQILDRISITVPAGQVVAVMGPSGSGKSSLLALLAGLERVDSGRVVVTPADARMGLVLQGYGLVSLLTAAENVEITLQALLVRGEIERSEIVPRAQRALASVGLSDVSDHLVEELSGGQQQRVAIARALAIDPQVLLADELTAELDHDSKQRVLGLVLQLAHQGTAVLLATHDPDVAAHCQAVLHLSDGRAIGEG
jgi:ABC-type lipoprotein export system ATPase subunit